MLKERETVIRDLNDIENRFQAHRWKVNDIHYWPIVKTILFFHWHQRYLKSRSVGNGGISKIKKIGRIAQLGVRLKSFFAWVRYFLFGSRERADVIFSGYWAHRVSFDEVDINRYFDPLIEVTKPGYVFIEYGVRHKNARIPNYERFGSLHSYMPLVRLVGMLYFRGLRKMVERELPISALSEQFSIARGPLLNLIVKEICTVQGYSIWFGLLIRRTRPKAVFGLCYYAASMYGLNLAAARLRVPSVDMQHGGQGELHPCYSGFQNLPDGGYALLPKFFWLWDSASKRTIDNWARNTVHRAVVGGNPWNILAIKNGILDQYRINSSGKRVALYTMQYPHLDNLMAEAIGKTRGKVFWLVRMHPRMLEFKAAILTQIELLGLSDFVDLENATSFPLPQLLLQADIHLSHFSGSIIEAFELGVTNIIIGTTGAAMYRDLEGDGKNYFFSEEGSGEMLAQLILSEDTEGRQKIRESDLKVKAVNAFREIVESDDVRRR